MRNALAALCVGIAAFSLVGCGSDENSTAPGDGDSVTINDHLKVSIQGTTDTQIYDVTLRDGTRCVVTDGDQAGGVDCDWDTP